MSIKLATAETLRQLRNEAGLSQEQLARQSGIERTYIRELNDPFVTSPLIRLKGLLAR